MQLEPPPCFVDGAISQETDCRWLDEVSHKKISDLGDTVRNFVVLERVPLEEPYTALAANLAVGSKMDLG